MRLGIGALGSTFGTAGGIDVYTHLLVEALADYDKTNQHYVILSEQGDLVDRPAISAWADRRWPRNVHFVVIRNRVPPETRGTRVQRRVRRKLGLGAEQVPTEGEAYRAYQIDGLRLDLVHYPRTAISPLCIETPCVLTFADLLHEYYPEFFSEQDRAARTKHFRAIVKKARHIITLSAHTKLTLNATYGVPNSRMTVIREGIPSTFRRVGKAEVDRVRAKYRLPENFIFYPANTWPHKNHKTLFKSLRTYRQRFGEAPILVVSGHLRGGHPKAVELAELEGVADRVLDLGYFPGEEATALFSAANMLVFPSLFEGFGIPLVEAMACGCPIAASNATSIPEVVGDAAFLFDPTDADDMASAIHRLATDEPFRMSLASKGLARAEYYRWERIVPELVSVYISSLKAREPLQKEVAD